MLKACKLQLYKIEISKILKQCRIVYYQDRKIDKQKLDELINKNIESITE